MSFCRHCRAEVPPEKAWCPQCNEPVEAEAKRTAQREIDTFAGTLLTPTKPTSAELARARVPVVKPVPPPPPTPPIGSTTAANPAITSTGQMPAIVPTPRVPLAPPPVPAEAAPPKPERSRLVTLVAAGLAVGLMLLIVMIVVVIVWWNYSR